MTFFSLESQRRRHPAAGFTMVELMATILILGVVISLALPSMGNLVRDQRVKTAVGDIHATLIFARSEAIKRNKVVGVCSQNADGSGCQNSTDWARGWIVYVDTDGAGVSDGYPNAVADILKKQDAFYDTTLTGNVGKLGYQGDGRVRRDTPGEPANTAPAFVVSVAGNDAVTARCVQLDLSGRPSVKVDTDKNGANGCQ